MLKLSCQMLLTTMSALFVALNLLFSTTINFQTLKPPFEIKKDGQIIKRMVKDQKKPPPPTPET